MEPTVIRNIPIPVLQTSIPNSQVIPSVPVLSSTEAQNGVAPTVIPDIAINTSQIAAETVGTSLDTMNRRILGTFTLGQVGGLKVGTFAIGVSGEIDITPNGITAIDKNNITTFAIDSQGNATFRGVVHSGSVISGSITLGGNADGSGVLQIADASGNVIIQEDHLGAHYYNITGHELVRVDSGGLTGFDGAGNQILKLKTSDLELYGTQGNIFQLFDSPTTTTPWAKLGYNTSTGFAHLTNLWALGTVQIRAFDAAGNYVTTNGYITLGDTSPNYQDVTIFAKNNLHLSSGGSVDINGTTKTAIVPTSEGYKALYTAEAPEVWFFDFVKLGQDPDPLFLEATEGEIHKILCVDGYSQIWRRRKGHALTRFEPKTFEEFERNNAFWQIPIS